MVLIDARPTSPQADSRPQRHLAAAQTAQWVERATAHVGAEAFVTMVVNTRGTDYFPGLLALASSLADTGTSRPLVVVLVGPKSPALAHAQASTPPALRLPPRA